MPQTTEKHRKYNRKLYNMFIILCLFCAFIFFYFIFTSNEKGSFDDGNCREWNQGWTLIGEDGTAIEQISLPTKIDTATNVSVRICKQLPNFLYGDNCIQVRSSQEEINIYIDGILRHVYSDEIYRPFGKSSSSATILLPIRDEDAGKEILLEIKSGLDSYSGILNGVYIGSERGLLFHILDQYYFAYVLAILILAIGVVCIGIYWFTKFTNTPKHELVYLGWLAVVLGAWLMFESDMRQFYFDSVIVANIMAYLMVILCPIPLLLYSNHLEKDRHIVSYNLVISGCILNFIVSMFLQLRGIMDLNELLPVSHFMIFTTLTVIALNFVNDFMHGLGDEVRVAVVGFIGLTLGSVAEIVRLSVDKSVSLGLFLSMGILFFISSIVIQTLIDMVSQEQKRKEAVMENDAKSKFLATMSHEIRTPINSVLGMNEMILRESREKKTLDYAQNISRAGTMLLSIVNDILDFSKIEAGKMQIVEVDYDMSSVLNDVFEMTNVRAREKGLEFVIHLDATMPRGYHGDEIRIKQIITNLLTNAIKYTSEGKVELTIYGRKLSSEWEQLGISVSDTGTGIHEEDLGHLFESFTRLDEVKNRGKEGTGLGLAITSGLLQAMNSKLEVTSEYGKGSRFYFTLDQKIIDSREIGELLSRSALDDDVMKHKRTNFTASKAKVLVVDDNAMNLEVIKALLTRLHMQVDTADNGEKALNMTQKTAYDIIFMDHMMPGMDGIETLQKIENKKIVIALTANAISGAKAMYIEAGFDDYLAKPILYDKLEAVLLQYLPEELIDKKINDILIDYNLGLTYCGDDKQTYLDVLKAYCKETKLSLAQMDEKLSAEDLSQYKIYVHSLKSTSLTIGAEKLSELAKELESRAKNDDLAYIREHHAACVEMTEQVIEQCEEYLQSEGVDIEPVEYESELEQRLQKVKEAVDDFDFGTAQDALDDVFHYIQEL